MKNDTNKPLSLFVVGVLVIGAGYLVFNNVNKKETPNSNSNIESNSNSNIESNSNIKSNSNSNKPVSNSNINKPSNSNSNVNIKEKTFTATFVSTDGAKIAQEKVSCKTTGNKCAIKTPNATKAGYVAYGYTTDKNSKKIQVKANANIAINKDVTYYLVLKIPIKATFIKSKADDPKTVVKTCYVDKKGESCNIVVPSYNKTGSYENTWALIEDKKECNYILADSIVTIDKDTTYYAQYHHPNKVLNTVYKHDKDRNLNIVRVVYVGKTRFEYEKGIPDNIINQHVSFCKKVYSKYPWYFGKGKVFVMTEATYNKVSSEYGTMTYSNAWFYADLKYHGKPISENATLHEMAHAFDDHFAYATGHEREYKYYLRNKPELQLIYDTETAAKHETLSQVEWFAAIVTDWFWHHKHLNDKETYYSGYEKYNSDNQEMLMKALDKYMKYAANGYK